LLQGYRQPTVTNQRRLKNILQPIFEKIFHYSSYGYRTNRLPHQAIRKIEEYLAQGYQWIVGADIEGRDLLVQEKIIEREKKKYPVGGPKEFQTTGYAHLYATFSPKKFVKLPRRPIEEMPLEWKKIIPLGGKKTKFLRRLLQKNLTCWIEKRFPNQP